jgi:hypothetical protein
MDIESSTLNLGNRSMESSWSRDVSRSFSNWIHSTVFSFWFLSRKRGFLFVTGGAVILGKQWQDGADYLDACRGKRNGPECDAAGKVSPADTGG